MVSRACNCDDGTHPPPYVDPQTKEWMCVDETPGNANNAKSKRERKKEALDRIKKRRIKEESGKYGRGVGGRRALLGKAMKRGSSER